MGNSTDKEVRRTIKSKARHASGCDRSSVTANPLRLPILFQQLVTKRKNLCRWKRQRFDSFWVKKGLGLDQFLLSSDKRTESFGQKTGVEWFLERLVDARSIKAHRVAVVWQQSDQNDLGEVGIFA